MLLCERLPKARLPHDVHGIDFVGQADVAVRDDASSGRRLVVQAAVQEEHQAALRPALRSLSDIVEQPLEVFLSRPVVARIGKAAVVANVHDVRTDVAQGDGGRRPLQAGSGVGRLGLFPDLKADRHAQLCDPAIGGVQHPVFVREQREAALAPFLAPGVLDDETFAGIADDGHRVPAVGAAFAADDRQAEAQQVIGEDVDDLRGARPRLAPAGVNHERGVEDARLGQRRVHVADIAMHDAIVGPAGRELRFRGDVVRQVLGAVQLVGPRSAAGRPVRHPALHRPAGGRALVGFAGPLVVAAGHLIQHPRTDRPPLIERRQQVAGRELKVDHRRQGETRAGPFLALIQNDGHPRTIHHLVRQRLERRLVEPVADIDPVRHGVELAVELLGGGCGRRGLAPLDGRWPRGLGTGILDCGRARRG